MCILWPPDFSADERPIAHSNFIRGKGADNEGGSGVVLVMAASVAGLDIGDQSSCIAVARKRGVGALPLIVGLLPGW